MKNTILKVESISKRFSNVLAVDNISFAVNRGEIFAFLGPNGAGKTTTLRILLDIIKADDGKIEWNLGGNSHHMPQPNLIGYLPEERGLYLDIPILKSLVYLASIRGMDKTEAKKSALEWLERLGLADRAKEKLQVLSKGNQQKIQFIASILHKPIFAILDEPFSGLDPLNQELFIEFIKEINSKGTTILLSAHQMHLVEKVANRVFLINKGRELYNGNLLDIYKTLGNKKIIELHYKSGLNENSLKNFKGAENIDVVDQSIVKLTFEQNTDIKSVLSELATTDGDFDISTHKPDLHDIFLYLVKNYKI
ncbi:ATP-binding cassette domain-containing protein [Ignavibacterium sp.]|uniref:ABC transporter ATP-binding protein n=1 Tax=Ignavibacterium sp. TaxID=2651167 RepID=UPI00307CD594